VNVDWGIVVLALSRHLVQRPGGSESISSGRSTKT